ncbi:hypothetical protein L917_01721 [Phytophthora nicotianae]|uniref:Uncharacterized protein n=1 Tax=Phytophthora nicotianae TaxID=4792 RepID=W2LYK4_PHYNI|nr:hypothetical protein L917_01721 [Phytophthora nicotianae]
MEMIACAHHGECIGPIDDYSDLFRANFGVKGHTRCFSIMEDLVAAQLTMGLCPYDFPMTSTRIATCIDASPRRIVTICTGDHGS